MELAQNGRINPVRPPKADQRTKETPYQPNDIGNGLTANCHD
eukprot:CAMPEP_0172877684 /NCGR_PEP_ID=MMETSP1075-20121228/107638_1 /TAXON_ID=2916 /ORGANISM="Ceratium fusus, Strain PA161109" /LENGTH=41 /DNA_ID= /DNA_START= /DNA_END= /DNA_ORIENTATION=